MSAAMVNAVHLASGKSAAMAVLAKTENRPRFSNKLEVADELLSSVGRRVHRCSLRKSKIGKAKIDEQGHEPAFRWLIDQKEGVFLVQLQNSHGGLHAIAVDCKRRLVLDSAEDKALSLDKKVVWLCGGQGDVWIS